MTQTSAALEITDVSITFASKRGRVSALEGVDLDVQAGEFITIAGPSGCGKSTLLKAVAGLTLPSSGRVRLNGEDVTGPRQDIGYVFQRAALLEWRSVRGNILLQAEMRGMDSKKAQARSACLISFLTSAGVFAGRPKRVWMAFSSRSSKSL